MGKKINFELSAILTFSLLWLLFTLYTQCSAIIKKVEKSGRFRESRILGGVSAIPQEFASLVSMQYPNIGHFCGGTIVNPRWIITAAHCLEEPKPSLITIVAGEHSLKLVEETEQKRKVKQVVIHPNYNRAQLAYDVALIELQTPLNLSGISVQAAQLAPANFKHDDDSHNLYGNDTGTVSAVTVGWGLQGNNKLVVSDTVRKVHVPLVTEKRCKEQYAETPYEVLPSMICAGDSKRAACLGDSGGPLFCYGENEQRKQEHFLCGIVSGGLACSGGDYAGFYSRVSIFRDWVQSTIGKTKFNHTMTISKSNNTNYSD